MTTAEKEPLTDLIDEYSTWLERRQELSTIEERDGHVPPSRWHESDDQAVFLLHRLADSARGERLGSTTSR